MGSSLLWDGWNEVPSASGPLGQTNVGPAAVNTSGSVVLIAPGLDRAVWFNTARGGQNWSGWKSIGGQTDFALCVIPGGLDSALRGIGAWAWATGTNPPGHIFQNQSDDAQSWEGWSELGGGGVAIAAPATTLSGHILVPGTDHRIYIKKSLVDDSPFTILPPGDLRTTQGLCLMHYIGPGNQSYEVAFAVSTNQKIYQNIYFTQNISLPTGQWTEVPGGGVTNVAVAATQLPGTTTTCLFAVGTDNKIYVNELRPTAFGDVTSWNGWGKLDDVGATDAALAAVAVEPLVYLFRKGLGDDKRIYFNVGEFPPR